MKLITISAAVALQIFIFSPQATCQNNKPQTEQLHLMIGTAPGRIYLSASSMERDLSNPATSSVLQLKGNVEIRVVACMPAGQGTALACKDAMVLNAEEAEYHEDTGEIFIGRGNVHARPAK